MNPEEIRNHCIQKIAVTEEFPFDNETLVFKVAGKAFLLTNISNPISINLKCDPEIAVELREKYDTILPGYHMNKKHWNTVMLKGNYSNKEILEWIDHSYELVVSGLSVKVRQSLSNQHINKLK
jgi:predicted DNA-binding protein (MmcQ/YjbR family)